MARPFDCCVACFDCGDPSSNRDQANERKRNKEGKERMQRPIKKTREYWDFNEIQVWVESTLGYQIRDVNGKFSKPNNRDAEYLDFWHWLCDECYNISNGCFIYMPEEASEPWQKPILEAFRKIVGDEEVWVEW